MEFCCRTLFLLVWCGWTGSLLYPTFLSCLCFISTNSVPRYLPRKQPNRASLMSSLVRVFTRCNDNIITSTSYFKSVASFDCTEHFIWLSLFFLVRKRASEKMAARKLDSSRSQFLRGHFPHTRFLLSFAVNGLRKRKVARSLSTTVETSNRRQNPSRLELLMLHSLGYWEGAVCPQHVPGRLPGTEYTAATSGSCTRYWNFLRVLCLLWGFSCRFI